MKTDLREISTTPDRKTAKAATAVFGKKYAAKYDKAVVRLTKDRDTLLRFFDFPAEHWAHPRTANLFESVFSTVRHRTVRVKGALSPETATLMVFKPIQAAAKNWRRLNGGNQLPKVFRGVKFRGGIEADDAVDKSSHPAA